MEADSTTAGISAGGGRGFATGLRATRAFDFGAGLALGFLVVLFRFDGIEAAVDVGGV
jgi:hypothetical protein